MTRTRATKIRNQSVTSDATEALETLAAHLDAQESAERTLNAITNALDASDADAEATRDAHMLALAEALEAQAQDAQDAESANDARILAELADADAYDVAEATRDAEIVAELDAEAFTVAEADAIADAEAQDTQYDDAEANVLARVLEASHAESALDDEARAVETIRKLRAHETLTRADYDPMLTLTEATTESARAFIAALDASTDAPTDARADADAINEGASDAIGAQARAKDAENAIRALTKEHFNGSYESLIRTLVRSVPRDTRNRALFSRAWNSERSAVVYDLCGTKLTIARNDKGAWITNGITDEFTDGRGHVVKATYADGSTKDGQLEEARAARNALAGWRMYVLRSIQERETTTRVANRVANTSAIEARASSAEARASSAEERAQIAEDVAQAAIAQAQATALQLAELLERLNAQAS